MIKHTVFGNKTKKNILWQGWPIQIGVWDAFGKIVKNNEFWGYFMEKTESPK
jgi:hypothetical protein